jgi:hypothetical protein
VTEREAFHRFLAEVEGDGARADLFQFWLVYERVLAAMARERRIATDREIDEVIYTLELAEAMYRVNLEEPGGWREERPMQPPPRAEVEAALSRVPDPTFAAAMDDAGDTVIGEQAALSDHSARAAIETMNAAWRKPEPPYFARGKIEKAVKMFDARGGRNDVAAALTLSNPKDATRIRRMFELDLFSLNDRGKLWVSSLVRQERGRIALRYWDGGRWHDPLR